MTFSVLGTDTTTNERVELSQGDRREGLYLLGATGTGKSTMLENLILQDITQGLGVCVLDPHGDLVNAVLSRMRKRLDDVILVDLGSRDYVAGLNLFHCEHPDDPFEAENIVQAVMHILEKVYEISRGTPQMNQYFINITNTLIYNPQATVLDIPRLLTDKPFRATLLVNVPDEHVRWFWTEFFEHRQRLRRDDEIASTVNKLVEFNSRILKPWFGQPKPTLHMRQIMDERKILLVKLKARWQSMNSLIGSILISQILDAAYSREDTRINKRKQFNVYADEFQRFATQDFATLFTEARKYGIGITIAHQVFEQLDATIKATIKQAANIVVFRVSSDNAKEIAGEFDCTPPPGEWIYERMMRKVTQTEVMKWWEPPEAEQHMRDALVALEKVRVQQVSLAERFAVAPLLKTVKFQGWHTIPNYTDIELRLPLTLPPAVTQRDTLTYPAHIEKAYLPLVQLPDPPEWDVMLHVFSQPLIPDTPLWNGIVAQYKQGKYGSLLDISWGGHDREENKKRGYNAYDYFFQQFYIPWYDSAVVYKTNWLGNTVRNESLYQYITSDVIRSLYPYYTLAPHITPGVAYPIPPDIPLHIEVNWDSFSDGSSSTFGTLRTEAKQALGKEIRVVIAPYKQGAYVYFDREGYEQWSRDDTQDHIFYKIRQYGYKGSDLRFVDRHSQYEPPIDYHWHGPYFPYEKELWTALIAWIQKTLLRIHEKKQYWVKKVVELAYCFHEGTQEIFLGWYEPETITELEYNARGSLLENEKVKYTRRMGPPLYGTDEVERRIANEMKSLPPFTARVRLKTGEHTIKTLAQHGEKQDEQDEEKQKKQVWVSDKQLHERIVEIQKENKDKGYLRLRSEVEAELSTCTMAVPQPKPAKPQVKPSSPPATDTTPPPKKRPKIL